MKIILSYLTEESNSHIFLLETGSRPVVGSSKNIYLGLPKRAMATHNFLFCPPLRFST